MRVFEARRVLFGGGPLVRGGRGLQRCLSNSGARGPPGARRVTRSFLNRDIYYIYIESMVQVYYKITINCSTLVRERGALFLFSFIGD